MQSTDLARGFTLQTSMGPRGKGKNEENLFCQLGTSIRLHAEKPRMYTRSLSIGASRRRAMSFLRAVRLDDKFDPFVEFQETLGFVPKLFYAQTLLPRVIEAQARIAATVLLKDKALSRIQKEQIILMVAAARQDTYCVTAHRKILSSLGKSEAQLDRLLTDYRRAGFSEADVALLDFSAKLSQHASSVHSGDIETLRGCGLDDESILEAVQVTALACFLCTLSAGLAPEPDFEPRKLSSPTISPPREPGSPGKVAQWPRAPGEKGPYLRAVYQSPKTFGPFRFFQKNLGFIPNIFRAQTLRPDVLEAEAEAVGKILLTEDVLTRVQKESILLVVSAANLNSYCVAVHCDMLRGLGIPSEESDQIAVDHHQSNLTEADRALLDFTLKLGVRPLEFCREDVDRLRGHGFTEEQVLESEVMTALTNFLNTLQMGLGVEPDFEPPFVLEQNKVHLPAAANAPMERGFVAPTLTTVHDPDAGLVAQAQGGKLEAFEELVRRHSQLIYRALVAILGDPVEAQDGMQDALLSAFKHIAGFQGRSKFSTWLVSIARNTAFQRLRGRREVESLDEGECEEDHDFRPRQVRAWQDNPEQCCSKSEIRQLIEKGISGLPPKYRVVVMLRDVEQLSTDEVARQLGLSAPAVKVRLLRGRLMLREWLSPHFATSVKRATP
jgi:RNA polymerase sigma-70 factor, ECF subfamily